jgi:hypothetical protein
MKARAVIIQGALAVSGLLAVYATWQREPERAPGEVVVLDVGKNELERVRYEDGTKWSELLRHRDGSDPGVWLRFGTREPPGAEGGVRDAGTDGGVAAKPIEAKAPEGEVRGNELAEKLLEKLAPLRASRSLGVLDEPKLRELGLEGSTKRLEIFSSSGRRGVYLLASSPLGIGAPYLESEPDKHVYLLGSSILSDLDSASTRLIDRRLHNFKQLEFDSLVVRSQDKQRELVQSGVDPNQPLKVASKKSPGKPDDFARNWHDKVWHLIVTDVLGRGQAPSSGPPVVAFRVEYKQRGKSLGWIEVSLPRPGASGSPPEVYARTEHTAGWVKVHAPGEDLSKEAKQVAAEP